MPEAPTTQEITEAIGTLPWGIGNQDQIIRTKDVPGASLYNGARNPVSRTRAETFLEMLWCGKAKGFREFCAKSSVGRGARINHLYVCVWMHSIS